MNPPNYGHYDPSTPPTFTMPKPKRSKAPWIVGGLLGLGLLACAGSCVAIVAGSDTKPAGDKAITVAGPTGTRPATATKPAPLPVKPKANPKPAEFVLTVKVLEKECFGSAGCNVQYRISKVTYTGPGLDKDETYEISYKVTGLESPKLGTFTLGGDGTYSVDETEYGQTTSSGKVLKAVVTGVEVM